MTGTRPYNEAQQHELRVMSRRLADADRALEVAEETRSAAADEIRRMRDDIAQDFERRISRIASERLGR